MAIYPFPMQPHRIHAPRDESGAAQECAQVIPFADAIFKARSGLLAAADAAQLSTAQSVLALATAFAEPWRCSVLTPEVRAFLAMPSESLDSHKSPANTVALSRTFPLAGSAEFAALAAETYQMALCRDWPTAAFMDPALVDGLRPAGTQPISDSQRNRLAQTSADVGEVCERLDGLRWFRGDKPAAGNVSEPARRFGRVQDWSTVFRGPGEDRWPTPFISQFLATKAVCQASDEGQNHLTQWSDWQDAQAGLLPPRPTAATSDTPKAPVTRLGDLATLARDVDPRELFGDAAKHLLAQGFERETTFADCDEITLLALLDEAASKAEAAATHAPHSALRPDQMAALFHTIHTQYQPDRASGGMPWPKAGASDHAIARAHLETTLATYAMPEGMYSLGSEPGLADILADICQHNARLNGDLAERRVGPHWLLPIAFADGASAVAEQQVASCAAAAACATVLKAIFKMDDTLPVYLVSPGQDASVALAEGSLAVTQRQGLTLQSEINKLLWNHALGWAIAGTQFYCQSVEAAQLGEDAALAILTEQMASQASTHSINVPLFAARRLNDPLELTSHVTLTAVGPAAT